MYMVQNFTKMRLKLYNLSSGNSIVVLLLPGGHLIQEFAEIPQTLESAGVLPAKCSEEGVGSCLMLYSPFPSWV